MLNDMIHSLNDKERIAVVRALLLLVKIDGRVDERERESMHEIVDIYGLSENLSVLKDMMTEEEILKNLQQYMSDRPKALFVIKELLTLANIDDDFDNKEAKFVEKAAKVLNVEEEKVLAINELILDRKIWLMKEAKIMEYKF